ncbi:MAG: hypothetical protein RIR70_516, partial [Pseudomonadota bacterium]
MKTSLVAAVIATAVLGGCSTNFLQYQTAVVQDQEKKAREAKLKNEIVLDQAKHQKSSAVVVSDKVFLGAKPVPLSTAVKPPEY